MPKMRLPLRTALFCATAFIALFMLVFPERTTTALAGLEAPTANAIVTENQQPGSDAWQLERSGFSTANDSSKQIKGYASATSVNKGSNINFFVSVSPAQSYNIDVYRIGWYNGNGGRLMQHIGPLNGIRQNACSPDSTTGLIACSWSLAYTLAVPSSWTSGIYLALLTNSQNYQNYIMFVVRDDSRTADILYQQSVDTYQAYNDYPDDGATGKGLYEYNSYGANTVSGTTRAVKVSFDRPYTAEGAGQFLLWEINFVRWLEKSGYDVAYSTDIDTHASGSRLLNYKAFLSVGHDEYWSKQMYDAAVNARDAGINLGFFGANDVYWQVRFENSSGGVPNRIMVCYKNENTDPNTNSSLKTVNWRDPPVNRPEQTLIGIQYSAQVDWNNLATYTVQNSSNWVYSGTGCSNGSTVPGIVGYESDRYMSQYPLPPNTSYTLLSQENIIDINHGADMANSVIYTAPSGARVFGAGTISWGWGLDNYGGHNTADARIQRTTSNVLDNFVSGGGGAGTPTRTRTPIPGTPVSASTVYADSLVNGWSNASWNSTVNFAAASFVHAGNYAIGCTYTGAYGASFLAHNGFNTTGFSNLVFYINGGSSSGQIINIDLIVNNQIPVELNLNSYVEGGSVAANNWRRVSVPLSNLQGANTTITGIILQDNSGNAQPQFFVDDVQFTGSAASTPTKTPTGGPANTSTRTPTRAGTNTRTSTPAGTPTRTRTPIPGTPVSASTVYADSLVNGWSNASWNSTVNFAAASFVHAGNYAIGCTYTGAYGALFLAHNGFNTTGFSNLVFYINGGSSSGRNINIDLIVNNDIPVELNLNSYVEGGSVAANTWRRVSVPLSNLQGANKVITGIILQDDTGSSQPQFFVDDVQFMP